MQKEEQIVDIDTIMNENPVSIDSLLEDSNIEKIAKDNKIERIQIGLIVFLVIVGTLVYFFGYDYVEPFIKVD